MELKRLTDEIRKTIDPACDHCKYDMNTCGEDGHFFCKEQADKIISLIQPLIEQEKEKVARECQIAIDQAFSKGYEAGISKG
jgi:hypothetical protein